MERLIAFIKSFFYKPGCPSCKFSMKSKKINLECGTCNGFSKYEYKDWNKCQLKKK